jgi:hypothetical protein
MDQQQTRIEFVHEHLIKAGPADAKVPASFAGIADLLRVLKHLKFALNVALFVRSYAVVWVMA